MVHSVAQTDLLQNVLRPGCALGRPHAGIHHGQGHIFERRVARHQVERLEDESYAAVADVRQGVIIERTHILPGEFIPA